MQILDQARFGRFRHYLRITKIWRKKISCLSTQTTGPKLVTNLIEKLRGGNFHDETHKAPWKLFFKIEHLNSFF